MSYRAGSAFVDVKPDMSTFQDDIKAELEKTPDLAIKVTADTADAKAQLDALGADSKATVTADADTKPAEARLDALTKKKRSAVIDVTEKLQKGGTLTDLLNPVAGIAAGSVALGPQALGLGLGVAGIGAGFAAAAADAAAFGLVAKGMFTDVEAAQKKLTTAQQAYNKATTDAGRAKALADEKAALDGLTPAEQELARQLTALSGAWKQLKDAEQPVVGAAITPWLSAAIDGMKLLKPLVSDGANAIQLLGNEADAAIKSPFWARFSDIFGQTGEEALQVFGTAAGDVADGLAHIFIAFAPDIQNVLPLVDKLAGSFDHWASSVTDKGLDGFFKTTFSPANVHALAQDGKDLASFLENVAKASQDMSPLAFGGISNVLDILGSLPPGVIEAATALFLAVKTAGTVGQAINGISNVISGVKGLFGGGAQTAEAEAEGTAAGTAGGTSAATAFTSTFAAEVTAALPAAFTEVGATGSTESAAAGTAMGTAAATAFGTSFATEDALGVTAAVTAVGTEASVEAGVAGAAIGTALATGFAGSLGTMGAAVAAALPEAGLGLVLAAGLAGAALGGAVGVGFNLGFAATGASGAAGKIEGGVKAATADAKSWLQPAGQQAADGFGTGFLSQQSKVQADVGQVKGWTQAGAAGSSTWIAPHGQQAAQGFATGFASAHGIVNNGAAQLKGWVTAALPSPASWLVNAGVSVMQGFLNGLVSEAGAVYAEADSIANTVIGKIKSALGIASPSKVTHELGVFTGQGFGLGLASTGSFIGQQASYLATVSAQSLASIAASQSLSQLGIAAPARLPGVGSPLSGGGLQLQVSYAGSGNQLTDALVGGLQFHIVHATGGDVQAALGQGSVRT